jgi:hypothetical protein
MEIPNDLLPGDILGFKGLAIVRWKTDGKAGHVAVYVGDGNVITALTNGGVAQYPLAIQGDLVWVRRPTGTFDLAKAMEWFVKVRGEKYGWDDIANVAGIKQIQQGNDDEMDCSDTASNLLQAAGVPQFGTAYDKESITPRDFEIVHESLSVQVWAVPDGQPAAYVAPPAYPPHGDLVTPPS